VTAVTSAFARVRAVPTRAVRVADIDGGLSSGFRVLSLDSKPPLFDHLVREGEQLRWQAKAERPRGGEVDH
jgi:hypothetical protein